MKRYPAYKDSGVEWIGEIPNHWNVLPLKRYLTVHSGDFHNINDDSSEEIGYPIFGGNGLRGYSKKYNFTGESILIGRVGAKCGNIHLVSGKYWISEHALRVMPKKTFNNIFFKYLIERVDLNQFAIRTAQPLINTTIVESQIVGLPLSNIEQSQIATFLDHKTRQIDDLIEKKQNLIELLKEERTAIINHAVTKGLNPAVPIKDSGIEWLGEIPENWEVKRLKFLSKTVQTGNTPPSEKKEYYKNPDIDWFTPSDFGDNLNLRDSNRKIHSNAIKDGVAKLFNPFSVLIIGIGATLGKIGMIGTYASSNQQINSIEFSDIMNPTFAAYYLRTFESVIKNMSNAATLAILNQSNTKNIVFICPPKEDQDKIARYIEEKVSYVELMTSRITKEIELISEYKTSLINEAITGKIDVRE
jgi:type I restriction enzyme S subunit